MAYFGEFAGNYYYKPAGLGNIRGDVCRHPRKQPEREPNDGLRRK
jgi:hypothetical protein